MAAGGQQVVDGGGKMVSIELFLWWSCVKNTMFPKGIFFLSFGTKSFISARSSSRAQQASVCPRSLDTAQGSCVPSRVHSQAGRSGPLPRRPRAQSHRRDRIRSVQSTGPGANLTLSAPRSGQCHRGGNLCPDIKRHKKNINFQVLLEELRYCTRHKILCWRTQN